MKHPPRMVSITRADSVSFQTKPRGLYGVRLKLCFENFSFSTCHLHCQGGLRQKESQTAVGARFSTLLALDVRLT
jgi:hypothetical protein